MRNIKRLRNKRGQAAMEFLMTYGWAILAAIIAIGVLAAFGVFSPQKLVGSAGLINAPFNMDAFIIEDEAAAPTCKAVGAGDCIRMEITQNLGTTIKGDATLTLTVTSGAGWSSTTDPLACTHDLGVGVDWVSGAKVLWTCEDGANNAWGDGVSTSSDISLTYQKTDSSLDQASSGTVRGITA